MKPKVMLASLLACVGVIGSAAAQQAAPAAGSDDPAALRAEIERLKSIVPGQAFAQKIARLLFDAGIKVKVVEWGFSGEGARATVRERSRMPRGR